jgi:hypothetical protein
MKQIIKKVVIPIVILILVVGWVQEISLRRAIQATANVMEPFARQSKDRWAISYYKFGIIRVVSEDDSISQTLGWIIGYEPDALRNGLNVHVNLFGEVVWVSDGYVNNVIRLLRADDEEDANKAFEEMEPI